MLPTFVPSPLVSFLAQRLFFLYNLFQKIKVEPNNKAYSMSLANIERLPRNLLGHILDELSALTGSEGIVNQADIPFIAKYAKALACTSKTMYESMNSPEVTETLINSLSKKYLKPPEEIALTLDTMGTRRWLWSYIERSGDNETYRIIHAILRLFDDIAPREFFFRGAAERTDEGFILWTDPGPYSLVTPLGRIRISSHGGYKDPREFTHSLIAIRRLKGTFQSLRTRDFSGERGRIWKMEIPSDTIGITSSLMEEEMEIIDIKKTKALNGTHVLVGDTKKGNLSLYNLNEIDGCILPKVLQDVKPWRHQQLIEHIWKMLEMKQEGGDPITLSCLTSEAEADISIPKLLFKDLSEFIPWQIDCIKRLTEQPGPFGLEKLIFESEDEIKLFRWIDGIHRLYSSHFHIDIPNRMIRLTRWPNFSELETLYRTGFHQLQSNWRRARLKDHPEIIKRQSEEEYILFFKESCSPAMGPCLRLIAKHLGIRTSVISCGRLEQDHWPVYMWVRKDKVEEVIATLNLKILG